MGEGVLASLPPRPLGPPPPGPLKRPAAGDHGHIREFPFADEVGVLQHRAGGDDDVVAGGGCAECFGEDREGALGHRHPVDPLHRVGCAPEELIADEHERHGDEDGAGSGALTQRRGARRGGEHPHAGEEHGGEDRQEEPHGGGGVARGRPVVGHVEEQHRHDEEREHHAERAGGADADHPRDAHQAEREDDAQAVALDDLDVLDGVLFEVVEAEASLFVGEGVARLPEPAEHELIADEERDDGDEGAQDSGDEVGERSRDRSHDSGPLAPVVRGEG
jgi:hypothetical protein